MRYCCKCKNESGNQFLCKLCAAAYNKSYRAKNKERLNLKRIAYREANLARVKAAQRDHYRRHAEEVKAKSRRYYEENKEKIKPISRAYHEKNAIAGRLRAAKWKAKNPERSKELKRAACLNRIARKKSAPGRYTIADIKTLYEKQSGLCTVCRTSLSKGYEVDHMNPLSRGGSNWPDNLQLLCAPCNQRKGAKTMQEFVGV